MPAQTLRIDHAAKLCTWGRLHLTMDKTHKVPGGFVFLGTAEPYVPCRFEVYPEQGRLLCDDIEHRLMNWRVSGPVATAETQDMADDDGWARWWTGEI